MSRTHLKAILPQIHQLFGSGTNIGMSDRVLLRRYCTSGDENAFTTLVARHGAMVLSVCQGVLRDESRAEDAFQAVWLVLVHRARSIRIDDSLGGWLHGVAYRVAVRCGPTVPEEGCASGRGWTLTAPTRPKLPSLTRALVLCTKRSPACRIRCVNPSCCAFWKGKLRLKRPRRSAAERPPSDAGWQVLGSGFAPDSNAMASTRRFRYRSRPCRRDSSNSPPARRAGRRARLPRPRCVRCHAVCR